MGPQKGSLIRRLQVVNISSQLENTRDVYVFNGKVSENKSPVTEANNTRLKIALDFFVVFLQWLSKRSGKHIFPSP